MRTLLALLLLISCSMSAFAQTTLTWAVFSYLGDEWTEAQYAPLVEYLNETLHDERIELLVLPQPEIDRRIRDGTVDIVTTNPTHFLVARQITPLTGVIATLMTSDGGQPVSRLGGTIIARADRHDIGRLADIRNRVVAAPSTLNMGAYRAQAYELAQIGIRSPQDFAAFHELGTQQAVVHAVLDGRAEVGFIRDSILERMIARGEIDARSLKLVGERDEPHHPFRVSTRLYPEWPVFALPHVDERAVRHIAAALYALDPDHPAARAAGIHGYTIPADYHPVEELARQLRLPPFEQAPDFTWADVWAKYGYVGFALGVAMAATLLLSILLVVRNRMLKSQAVRLELSASVFSHAREGIMITDADGVILDVNAMFTDITGYTRDEIVGHKPSVLRSGRHDQRFYAGMWQRLRDTGQWYGEILNRHKDGDLYVEALTISSVRGRDGAPSHYVALFSDITKQKEQERQLRRIAHYDALTGLPNRVLLADRLEQAMTRAKRQHSRLVLACIDLDGFKEVNDRHGHGVGDRLLIRVAEHMHESLREGDTVARLGGDEFVALLPDVNDHAASFAMINRLLAGIARPIDVDGQLLKVSGSIGLTFYPQDEPVTADQLLRQADQAMYQAKLAGKNRFHVFDSEHDRSLRGYHEELQRIRQGLERDEFVLHYQPKVNLRTGTAVGFEALIRWKHPDRGLLSPVEFLPVLEKHELDIAVGEWVIKTALEQLEIWREHGIELPVSINLSGHHLQQPGFTNRLAGILAAHPSIPPAHLELEVLESSALADMNMIARVIESCAELGVTFALDDFGTGYSSLTYLKRLPARTIKIDRSFVRDMLDDPDDLAILEGVLGLAAAFHRAVIAEGLETPEHGALLVRLGCEFAQGFAIAHPMPSEQIPEWIRTWKPHSDWTTARPVRRDALPILYAGVEHRAWMARLEAFLADRAGIPPPLDPLACRFGKWMDRYSDDANAASLQEIDTLHRRLHELADALVELRATGRQTAPSAALTELHTISNRLLTALNALLDQPAADLTRDGGRSAYP